MIPRSCTLPVTFLYGYRRRVAECASCGQVRPLIYRGLCNPCTTRHFYAGTITEFGYVKADRMADFARLRAGGAGVTEAAARLGISARTGHRYERELAASGRAPWRQWPGAAVRRATLPQRDAAVVVEAVAVPVPGA